MGHLPLSLVGAADYRRVRTRKAKSHWNCWNIPYLRRQSLRLDGALDSLDFDRYWILLRGRDRLVYQLLPDRYPWWSRLRGRYRRSLEFLPQQSPRSRLLPSDRCCHHNARHLEGCEGHREGQRRPDDFALRSPLRCPLPRLRDGLR